MCIFHPGFVLHRVSHGSSHVSLARRWFHVIGQALWFEWPSLRGLSWMAWRPNPLGVQATLPWVSALSKGSLVPIEPVFVLFLDPKDVGSRPKASSGVNVVAARSMDGEQRQGELRVRTKRSGGKSLFTRNWQKRHVELEEGSFRVYAREEERVPLVDVDVKSTAVATLGSKPREIVLYRVLGGQELEEIIHVSASTREERDRWLKALQVQGAVLQDSALAALATVTKEVNGDGRKTAEFRKKTETRSKSHDEHPHPPVNPHSATHVPPVPPSPMHAQARLASQRASAPVHRAPRYSMLSSERLSYERHAGLINLGVVVLLATHSRLVIENLLKYGIMRPKIWVHFLSKNGWLLLATTPILAAAPAFVFLLEWLAAKRVRKDKFRPRDQGIMITFEAIAAISALFLPCVLILRADAPPLHGFLLIFPTVILWMKLVSYAHCNADLREEAISSKRVTGSEVLAVQDAVMQRYPDNVNMKDFLYFLAAPTLCYQTGFPRSERLRPRWLLRRFAELIFMAGLQLFLVEQYVLPTVHNSIDTLGHMNFVGIAERVLKLSIPCLYVWLCSFYSLFHLWLNIVAELLQFGDREFYKDWWNASTLDDYWRLWNTPVHKWLLRHIYYPCLRVGLSKNGAILMAFFFSAIFHELIIGVPLKVFRLWAFFGILLQVPLIAISKALVRFLQTEQLGNIFFWLTFCIFGQPICVLLYYHDYLLTHTHCP